MWLVSCPTNTLLAAPRPSRRPRGRRAALRRAPLRLLAIVPAMTSRRALPDAKIRWRIEQVICDHYSDRLLAVALHGGHCEKIRRRLDEIDKCAQRCGHETPTGKIEKRSREALPPGLKDRLESSAVQMRA